MKLLLKTRGKCSSFGGIKDMGVSQTEGLALFERPEVSSYRYRHLFIDVVPLGLGLARALDPDSHYCAMRWDYSLISRNRIRDCIVRVSFGVFAPVWCHPVDWGPNINTGRVIDLSPGAMNAIGVSTDQVVEIEVWL